MSSTNPWDGSQLELQPGDSANLPQTATGSTLLLYINGSDGNNAGTLSYASGGGKPTNVDVPGGTNQPGVVNHNWKGQNLAVTNTSGKDGIPIYIIAYGPGLNPPSCVGTLTPDGNPVKLKTPQCAQGNADPQWMTLRFQQNTNDLTIFTVIGGPQKGTGELNAYVFGLNMDTQAPPADGIPPAEGYYEKGGNTIDYQFKWGSDRIWVANVSPSTSPIAQVSMFPG